MPGDPQGYTVFADESGFGERFLALGALLLPTRSVAQVERALQEYCENRGLPRRELSWKKCSGSEVERYIDAIDLFWRLPEVTWDFRCIVLDQDTYPLKAPQYGAETEEDGFYRFYHSFLTRSIAKIAPNDPPYQLHIAITPDRYPHRTEVLQKTVGGTVGKAAGRSWQIVEILRGRPKSYRTHQMADVMVGAVTCRMNMRNQGSPKWALLEAIERNIGKQLDQDFKPWERPFNVWSFARAGDRRWAPGSEGRVR